VRRRDLITSRHAPPATPPGTLVRRRNARFDTALLRATRYGPARVDEFTIDGPKAVLEPSDLPYLWLDVRGSDDIDVLEWLGATFDLHVLTLEDVLNAGQRPKATQYGDYWFVIARHVVTALVNGEPRVVIEPVSLFLTADAVITLHDDDSDPFAAIRSRMAVATGRMRNRGPDYLAYAILDLLVDELFPVVESFGERFEMLESELLTSPRPELMRDVRELKGEMLRLRRVAWPTRELVATLDREPSELVTRGTKVFLRDTYEHTVEIMDIIETYRELATGLVELYLSSAAWRTNEIMRVLAGISTIFLPLTFIAGVYGMNFAPDAGPFSMPELRSPLGYPVVLVGMLALAVAMALWFRRKGWL
jgi:magnesium transporter